MKGYTVIENSAQYESQSLDNYNHLTLDPFHETAVVTEKSLACDCSFLVLCVAGGGGGGGGGRAEGEEDDLDSMQVTKNRRVTGVATFSLQLDDVFLNACWWNQHSLHQTALSLSLTGKVNNASSATINVFGDMSTVILSVWAWSRASTSL